MSDILTAREVADLLRCEYRKALRLLGNEIPAVYDGYRWTATRQDVQAYYESRKVVDRAGKNRRRGRGRRSAA